MESAHDTRASARAACPAGAPPAPGLIRINDILSLRPLRVRPYYSDKLLSNDGAPGRRTANSRLISALYKLLIQTTDVRSSPPKHFGPYCPTIRPETRHRKANAKPSVGRNSWKV